MKSPKMAKTAMEGFQNNVNYVRFFARFMNYDILAPTFKYNNRIFVIECMLFIFPTFLGVKALISSDITQSLISVSLAFAMIQVRFATEINKLLLENDTK